MKKRIAIVSIVLALMILSACSPVEMLVDRIAPQPDDSVPGRMVASIKVDASPEDPDLSRNYTEQDAVSSVLRQLQDLQTVDVPQNEPKLDEEDKYITITVTYANSESDSYCLLGKQYLRNLAGSWCIVDKDKAIEFVRYIEDTPSN